MDITERRLTGLGGTDAAVVLRQSPWKTPLDLYLEKVGEGSPFEPSERMDWGIRLEPVIAKAYCERTGRGITNMGNRFRRHSGKKFMTCHLDRMITDPEKGDGLLEIKTTSSFNKSDWEVEPPLYYQIQLQHQMAVTGDKWGAIAVLIGGQELVYQDMDRNDDFIADLMKKEEEFWGLVQSRTPPEADYERDTEGLRALYAASKATTIELPSEANIWKREIEQCAESISHLTKKQERYKNLFVEGLGENETGIIPGGGTVTRKPINRAGYTAKPSSYRQIRFQKGGKR